MHVLLTAWLYLLLLCLGLLSLSWNTVAFVLYPLLPRERGRVIGRAAIAYAYRWYWACARASGLMRIDASTLDALRDEPGGLIIAANHPTMLDALLIVARLPRSVCIMKASLMRNVFLGAGARLARYIRNDSPRKLVRRSIASLQEGGQLVLFPEGTRTERRPLNAFRPGITMIAHKARVPIQTVFIETDTPYLGKGWPIWRLPQLPIVFKVRLGQRFEPRADHAAALAELEDYFRRELSVVRPSEGARTAVHSTEEVTQ
ncbi:lysophospholipid acyltransferase family protein [Caldimonas brevitalea]|nr:lysophospholipid acyltransferase family protein [Caldimonas brevitalea]